MEGAYKRYFSDIKQEITINTNASNAIQQVIWYDNFILHQQLGISLVATLAELMAREQWNPEFVESNLVHRGIKNLVTTNIELLQARNRAQDALALMAVPTEMAKDLNYNQNLTGATFDATIKKLNWLDKQINIHCDRQANKNSATPGLRCGSFTQMTALLLNKTEFPFTNPRHKIGSSSSPIFNREMNAVIDNFVVYTSETENGSRTTRLYPAGNTPTVALPFAPDDVPCLVGAHLLLGFGASYTQTAGFPWFTPGVNSMLHGWTSSFMATTSSNAPGFNFLFDLRRRGS
jgi:uncharacterized protein YihD (DUF1040 family)